MVFKTQSQSTRYVSIKKNYYKAVSFFSSLFFFPSLFLNIVSIGSFLLFFSVARLSPHTR